MQKAIKKNQKQLEEGHYRTVGEMLYANKKSRNSSGSYELCVYNSQIQDEVHILFEAQREFDNTLATPEFEQAYIDCLIWEKKSIEYDEKIYRTVGKCSYFPDEYRAARADISSELCNAYERLGHLVIIKSDGAEQRLTPEQRNKYLAILFSTTPLPKNKDCKVTYSAIFNDLELNAKDSFKGIDKDKEKSTEIFEPKAWRALRKSISPELLERMYKSRSFGDEICEALTYASTEESLMTRLEALDLSDTELEQILNVPFAGKVFKGYANRSLKALNLLLDSFEEDEVMTLTEAEDASGLGSMRRSKDGTRSLYLPPYNTYDETCKNPVVLRAMGRMRRIINAIIRIYGPLDEIHIELGNELKRSQKEKKAIASNNKANEAANKKWRALAAEHLKLAPEDVPNKLVRKLSLREEQGEKDLYTGETIELQKLLDDERYCEIDHVLPYSRTCDDSRANKVLVLSKNNQNKRKRTPYEWMTSGEAGAPSWNEYLARVNTLVKSAKHKRYLLNTDLAEGDNQAKFLERNLNDTRYMTRAVKSYIEDSLIFAENGRTNHVLAVAGGATGNLRWVWGLNFGEHNSKDRSDDRHHAVDAAIIAACNASTVKKVADASKLGRETFKHMRKSRLTDTQPWPAFATEVIARREFVIPTRMSNHGVTGQAFEETLYHFEGLNKKNYPLLRAKGPSAKEPKTSPQGNVRINQDGSAHIYGGMAFLRLWFDPNYSGRGGKSGRWYAEPVYYADIPSIKNGSHIPKYCPGGTARVNWPVVPKEAMLDEPLVLFSGDVICINGNYGRFNKFHVSGCALEDVKDIGTGKVIKTNFPSGIRSWDASTTIQIIQEDCLGHCYNNLVLER